MEEGTMKKDNGKTLTKQIAISGVMLAICILSQFFKGISVYITGPVVNLCLILTVMIAGLKWGLVLSVITPVTAFIIAASPVMNAVPGIIPFIMLGNVVLVVMTYFFVKPTITGDSRIINIRFIIWSVLSAAAKGAVMGLTISLWLLPTFIQEASPLRQKLPVFQTMFSITQFVTALIGFVYFFIVWIPLRKVADKE